MEQEIETTPQEVKRGFPEPLDVDWQQIRSACEAGLDLKEASDIFKTSYEAVRKRSQREGWLHPAKVEALKNEKRQQALLSRGCPDSQKPVLTASEAVSTVLEGERTRGVTGLAKMLGNAFSDEMVQNMKPKDVPEAVQMGNLLVKFYNLASDSSVQVNIAQAFAGMDEGPVVSLSEDQAEDETDSQLYFVDDE